MPSVDGNYCSGTFMKSECRSNRRDHESWQSYCMIHLLDRLSRPRKIGITRQLPYYFDYFMDTNNVSCELTKSRKGFDMMKHTVTRR
jgi:hypothetical protein